MSRDAPAPPRAPLAATEVNARDDDDARRKPSWSTVSRLAHLFPPPPPKFLGDFRADASDPGTTVRSLILGGRPADEEFHRWTRRLGIEHILGRGLRFISTGEMRKTLLVAALLAKPALLVLDSPLDGLDIATQAQMHQVIDELPDAGMNLLLLCRQVEDIPASIFVAGVSPAVNCGLSSKTALERGERDYPRARHYWVATAHGS